jgi:hypothetical protein
LIDRLTANGGMVFEVSDMPWLYSIALTCRGGGVWNKILKSANPLWLQESLLPIKPFTCFFFVSSSLFFFPSTLAQHHERLALYTTILNDEHRVALPWSIFALSWLTFAFCIIVPFFLRWRIQALAPRLEGHALRLGITKNKGKPSQCTHFSNVDSPANVLLNALLPFGPLHSGTTTGTFGTMG